MLFIVRVAKGKGKHWAETKPVLIYWCIKSHHVTIQTLSDICDIEKGRHLVGSKMAFKIAKKVGFVFTPPTKILFYGEVINHRAQGWCAPVSIGIKPRTKKSGR